MMSQTGNNKTERARFRKICARPNARFLSCRVAAPDCSSSFFSTTWARRTYNTLAISSKRGARKVQARARRPFYFLVRLLALPNFDHRTLVFENLSLLLLLSLSLCSLFLSTSLSLSHARALGARESSLLSLFALFLLFFREKEGKEKKERKKRKEDSDEQQRAINLVGLLFEI